jgi:hypothetical protein
MIKNTPYKHSKGTMDVVEALFRFNLHRDNEDEVRILLCQMQDASLITQNLCLKHNQALLSCLESGQMEEAEKHLPYITKLADLLPTASPQASSWIVNRMTILQVNEGLLFGAEHDNVNMVSHLAPLANNHNDSFLTACRRGSVNCLPILLPFAKSTIEGVTLTISGGHVEAFRTLFFYEVETDAEKKSAFVRYCLIVAALYNSLKILHIIVPFAILCARCLVDSDSSVQTQMFRIKNYFFLDAYKIAALNGTSDVLSALGPYLITA